MPESLFREEAVRGLSARYLDARRLQAPVSMLIASGGLFLLLTIAVTIIGSADYARKHMVTGQLDETSTSALHATDYGFLSELHVVEGETVTRGQQLAKIRHLEDESKLSSVKELQRRASQLKDAMTQTSITAEHQLSALSEQNQQLNIRIQITRQNLALQKIKVSEMQAQLNRTADLHQQGHLSNLDWLGFRASLTNEKQQSYEYQEQLVKLQQQIRDLDHRKKQSDAERQKSQLQLELQLSQVRESLEKATTRPYQWLTASHDGVVSRIEVSRGGTVKPGQAVIYLNNDHEATTATLLVPPQATGRLQTDDQLNLELDAFPLESFGHVQATVEHIPKHTVIAGQTPYYPVRLRIIPSPKIDVYLPGMTMSGFIVVERRSIARWLLAPLSRKIESFS